MPIEELTRFREKYPQYNDVGDGELAGMLAAKYPAYKDLPSRVIQTPTTTPEFSVKHQPATQPTAAAGDRYAGLLGGSQAKISNPPGFLSKLVGEFAEPYFEAGRAAQEGRVQTAGERLMGGLRAFASPLTAIQRQAAESSQARGASPETAELIGDVAAFGTSLIPPITTTRALTNALRNRAARSAAPAVNELLASRRALPPPPAPTQQPVLPSPAQPRALPEPGNMIFEGSQLQTPGGATMAGEVRRTPPRTIVELVDEVKQDVKDRVIQELFDELKTGRTKTAASPQQPQRLLLPPPEPKPAATVAPGSTIAPAPRVEAQPLAEVAAEPISRPAVPPKPAKAPRQRLEDNEVAMSTFIKRQGGIKIPKELKEEFGGWNRLHSAKGLAVDEMAHEAFNAGLLPEPTTNALIDSLKSKRKQVRAPVDAIGQEVEAAADSKIRQLVNVDGPLEFKGKTYTGAIREGDNVRLKDNPDKVLKKADDILEVEEKIPFNIPPAEPEPFNPSRLKAAVLLDDGETIVGTAGRGGHKDIFEALPASQQQRVMATGFFDPTDPNPKNFYSTATDAERGYNARAGIEAPTPAPTRKVKAPSGELVEVPAQRAEAPSFEQTPAGKQAVIPGAEAREVPLTALRPKRAQTEAPFELEQPAIRAKEPELFGGEKKAEITEPRGLTAMLKSEKGQVGSTETNPIVTGPRLAVGETIEQSGKTLRKTMGAEGNELADRLVSVRNNAETNTGILSQPLEAAIKKLKKQDYENFVDVLEGNARPVNQEVRSATAIADKIRRNIAQRAEAVDLQIRNPLTGEYSPFRPRENYFPHYSKEEFAKIVENPTRRAEIKTQIKAQLGAEATDKQAEDALRAMIKASKHREPHLEIARVLDLGDYHKDPRVFLRYIHDANRRIAIAHEFGPKLERGEELLTAIGQNRGDKAESFARTLFNRELRIEEVPDTLSRRMIEAARNYEVFTKLGRAFIPNMSQHAYTAIITNAKDTAKGIAKSFTKEGRAFARRAGVVNDEILKEFFNEVSGATGEGKLRRAINIELAPFQWTEKLNRAAAANAGRYYARETFDALKKSPTKTRLRDTLSKMGVDVDAALSRGTLSTRDELKAAQNIVNRSQFKVDPIELPLFWSSPEGRLLTQFKTFSFKSGQFMKDEILKEIGKGNVGPLLRALAILPPAGYAVKKIQNLATMNKGEKDSVADYLAAVGVLGLFSDAFRTGARTGVGTIAGPTLSDVGGALDAISQTRQRIVEGKAGPLQPIAKFGARQVPVAGPALGRMLSEEREKSLRARTLEDLGIKRPSRKQTLKELGIGR